MSDIVIYGSGYKAEIVYGLLNEMKKAPILCIDSNKDKQGREWHGMRIEAPDKLTDCKNSFIFISATDINNEIYNLLLLYGIKPQKIKKFYEVILWIIKKDNGRVQKSINKWETIIFDTINGYNAGGVEEWSKSLLKEFQKKYPEMKMYLVGPAGEVIDDSQLLSNQMDVDINVEKKWSIKNLKLLISELIRKMPFIVVTGSQNITFFAALYLKIQYPDYVHIISVVHQGTDIAYKEYADTEKYLKNIVAVSKDIVQGLKEQGICYNKIQYMTCPVSIPKTFDREYSNGNLPIKIGYAGRIVIGQKRLDYLPYLLKQLSLRNINYYMELAGDGNYLESIEKLLIQEHLENKVKLLGKIKRDDIPQFWGRQDICINLSDHEGRSISIMEAMVNGAVPIVTATSGVRDDIIDAESGYIVELGDYVSMAERIETLYQDRSHLRVMGYNAHRIMVKKCSMKRHIKLWEELLLADKG